jgi:Dihydroorotase and related cyclic amidohydrolases
MVIDSSKFISKSKFSPFDGWKIKAKIETTIRRGKILFNNGEFYNLNYPSKNIIELIN